MNNRQLYVAVRSGFVAKHTSLNKWCVDHGIHRQNARDALLGVWKGARAKEICQILIEASGAEVRNSNHKVANQSCELLKQVRNSQDINS